MRFLAKALEILRRRGGAVFLEKTLRNLGWAFWLASLRPAEGGGARVPEGVPRNRGRGEVMIHLETPRAGEVSGDLTVVSGWALSPRGITSVEVYCDGRRTGDAELGIGRPDLAARRPDLYTAHQCGFRAFLRSEVIGDGKHILSVAARDSAANLQTASVPFEVEGPYSGYESWLSRTRPGGGGLRWMRDHSHLLPGRPGFHVLVSGDLGFALEATVRSLCRQAYPFWTASLPGDAEPDDLLHRIRCGDFRARFASPAAAPGPAFVLTLRAGDVLSPDCLFEFAVRVSLDPSIDLLCADHDTLDASGRRRSPCVLPEWEPAALASHPCWARFFAVRRELADGFPEIFPPGSIEAAPDPEAFRRLAHAVRRGARVGLPLISLGDPHRAPCVSSRDSGKAEPAARPATVVAEYSSSPSLEPWDVRSLLAVKVDHIGDMVLALPALRLLRRRFPRARIVGLAAPWVLPVVRGENVADEWETLDLFDPDSSKPPRTLSTCERAELRRRLRSHHFDLAVDLRPGGQTAFLLALSGAPVVAGFRSVGGAAGSALQVPRPPVPPASQESLHLADQLVHLVEAVSPPESAGGRRTAPPDPGTLGEAVRLLDDLTGTRHRFRIGIHPGGKVPLHHWSDEGFAALADLFSRDLGAQVVFFGAARDASAIERVRCGMKEPSWSAAGRFTLEEFLRAVAGCRLFVGNDSGPAHAAGAAGIPTIAVFNGIVDPRVWGPRGPHAMALRADVPCSPCGLADLAQCRNGEACRTGLSAAEVFTHARRLLAATGGAPERTSLTREAPGGSV